MKKKLLEKKNYHYVILDISDRQIYLICRPEDLQLY